MATVRYVILSNKSLIITALTLFYLFFSSWILPLLCNRPRLFILSTSIRKFISFISTWTGSYLEEWSGQSSGKWRRMWWSLCWTVHFSLLCLLLWKKYMAPLYYKNLSQRILNQDSNMPFDFILYCHPTVLQSYLHNWME